MLADLPTGEHEVLIWHPAQNSTLEASKQVIEVGRSDQNLAFSMKKEKQFKAWRAPKSFKRRGY